MCVCVHVRARACVCVCVCVRARAHIPLYLQIYAERYMFTILRDLNEDYSHKIIMGDLNADLSSKKDSDTRTVCNFAGELSLQIVQNGPTYPHPTPHRWIDAILTDDNDEIIDFKNEWLPSFGKHSILNVIISICVPAPVRDSFSFRDFNSVCPASLNRMLSCCDWEAMNSIEYDLEGALNNFNTNLNVVTAELAPLKTVSPKINDMLLGLGPS